MQSKMKCSVSNRLFKKKSDSLVAEPDFLCYYSRNESENNGETSVHTRCREAAK